MLQYYVRVLGWQHIAPVTDRLASRKLSSGNQATSLLVLNLFRSLVGYLHHAVMGGACIGNRDYSKVLRGNTVDMSPPLRGEKQVFTSSNFHLLLHHWIGNEDVCPVLHPKHISEGWVPNSYSLLKNTAFKSSILPFLSCRKRRRDHLSEATRPALSLYVRPSRLLIPLDHLT